jgi:uncharacterized membrane protein
MLSTFGIFWSGEGTGVAWPGQDLAILGILAFLTLVSLVLVGGLRRIHASRAALAAGAISVGE